MVAIGSSTLTLASGSGCALAPSTRPCDGASILRFTRKTVRVERFVTGAPVQDVPEADIMEQSGHRSIAVARQYRQVRDLRRRDAAGQVGL